MITDDDVLIGVLFRLDGTEDIKGGSKVLIAMNNAIRNIAFDDISFIGLLQKVKAS